MVLEAPSATASAGGLSCVHAASQSPTVLRHRASWLDAVLVDSQSDDVVFDAHADGLVGHALSVLGALGNSRTGRSLCFDEFYSPNLGKPTAGSDSAVRSSLSARLRLMGAPRCSPSNVCLQEVFKSVDTVDVTPTLAVRPYDADKLVAVKSTHSTVDLLPLLDDEAYAFATNYDDESLLDDELAAEAAAAVGPPYLDPALRCPAELLGLVLRLSARKLLVFRLSRRTVIGAFTVNKKDGKLRLVFDCRSANVLCRPPPKSFLSTSGGLSRLRLSKHALREGHRGQCDGTIVAVDLVDGFYLFRWTALS